MKRNILEECAEVIRSAQKLIDPCYPKSHLDWQQQAARVIAILEDANDPH